MIPTIHYSTSMVTPIFPPPPPPPPPPRRLDVQHIQFSTGEAVDQARFQCQLSQVDCHDGGRVGHGQEDLRSTSGPPRQLVCSLQPPIN